MTSDIQSVVAIAIVLTATAIVTYAAFFKKKTGCGSQGGCGCSGISKKTVFPQKSTKSSKNKLSE